MTSKTGFLVGIGLGAVAAGAAVRLLQRRSEAAPLVGVQSAPGARLSLWEPQRRVVILGAGFGGLTVAEGITAAEHDGLDVTLVDRRNYHLFSPFLYQVSSGLVDPLHIIYPARAVAARRRFRFRESAVTAVDLDGRRVFTDDGEIAYDDLVLALGAMPNDFGLPGVQEHALPLKTVADSLAVRNHVIDMFEAADVETDPDRRRELLSFAIGGGGPTGVELAGGLDGLIRYVLLRHYPTLRAEEITITVLEAEGQLLPGWDPFLVEAANRAMTRRGIVVRLNARVQRVTAEHIELQGGERIPARMVVWTAGVRPAGVVADLKVPKVQGGRLKVNAFLELPDYPGVFVIGDIAGWLDPQTGRPVPGLAATAQQQGHAVAVNLLRRARGLPMQPYRYHLLGQSLSLGRNEAAIQVGPLKMHGFLAWIGWRTAHLAMMRGWRNRLGVAFDWAFAYIFLRDTLRLEAEPERSP